jgi:hypothetical protein
VFGYEVVIQKDRVIRIRFEQLLRLGNIAGYVQHISLEALLEPGAAPFVIFK